MILCGNASLALLFHCSGNEVNNLKALTEIIRDLISFPKPLFKLLHANIV